MLMPERPDILISVQARFVEGMIAGSKQVELRRRAPKVAPNTRVWIYDKAPTASVRALAVLHTIESMAPTHVWDRHGDRIGLTEKEYADYVEGAETVSALILDHVHELRRPVSLNTLREITRGFHPPQFYLKLARSGALVHRLSQEIVCGCKACAA